MALPVSVNAVSWWSSREIYRDHVLHALENIIMAMATRDEMVTGRTQTAHGMIASTSATPLATDAESVLQNQSVEQARAHEKRTRAAVEQKKSELRELVGSSYRDVISSADNILEMRTKANQICERMLQMEHLVNTLLEHEREGRYKESSDDDPKVALKSTER